MWEAIRDNVRRSRMLIGVMGVMLVLLGYLIGVVMAGPDAGIFGALGALALWLVMLVAALSGGEQLVMMTARARQIRKEDAPQLWNIVEEMTIASGLAGMPKIYIVDNDMPNAFAAGRKPESSCVAVTTGLLRRLNRDELQGVIAHEIGHIKNYDVRFMTIAAVMLGSIVILADLFFRMLWLGGGRRRGGGGGGGHPLILLVAILAAFLAPLFAQLLYFACSRKREYLADASAARFTRYPAGLASALEKISGQLVRSGRKKEVQRALAPMYIINPLQAAAKSVGLFSTHPTTEQRVRILRAMGGNAGWADYDRAFRKVMKGRSSGIDARTLRSDEGVAAREPSAEAKGGKEALARGREVAEFLDRMVAFLIIACPCGVRIKVPPNLKRESIKCTRCGRKHPLPRAEAAAAAEGSDGAEASPLRYQRRSEGWETFKCACGHPLQVGPAFRHGTLTCTKCKRKVEIAGP